MKITYLSLLAVVMGASLSFGAVGTGCTDDEPPVVEPKLSI